MQIWSRRSFLKSSAVTSLALGLNATSPAFIRRQLLAGVAEGNTKLVFLFQRGGSDGVNTCIPHGDSQYNTTTRPTLYIPPAQSLDLGNNFAALHPGCSPMMEIYNSQALTGIDGLGNLAVIHRVGYSGQSQSHFDSQQYWENGDPSAPDYNEGIFYRQVERKLDPISNALSAVAVSGSQMVALRGRISLPALGNPANYKFDGDADKVRKFLGNEPSTPQGGDGDGFLGLYGGPRDFPGKSYRELVYGTGRALGDSMRIVQDAVAQGPYVPENGATYPGSFGSKIETVAMLLKRTPVRILGVNIGGWDTHTNQGGAAGGHRNLLYDVAHAFQSLSRDLADQWENLVIVTMTEFGRTSRENGSFGTDHANACVVFVGGGRVRGGTYNCDSTTWADGDLFSRSGRYLERRTDYRQIFKQIFDVQFGNTQADTDYVIPTYSAARTDANARGLPDFNPLSFIA